MGRIGKKIDGDELRSAYEEYGSIKKLAVLFHTSNGRMIKLLAENGIKTKNIGNKIELKKKDISLMIRDYVSNNMLMSEISEKYDINVTKIREIFRENGVKISKWHNHIKRRSTSRIGFIKQIEDLLSECGIEYQRYYRVRSNYKVSLMSNNICIDVFKNKDLIDHDGYEYRLRLRDKMNVCLENGFSCIQIFEDEYRDNPDKVLGKIKHIFGKDVPLKKIPGRECMIEEITSEIARAFLEENHIQGFVGSSVYLGAKFDDELVAVMSFSNDSKRGWCLTRFASKVDYVCQGVGGKLFKHFISTYKPDEVSSFADRRWTLQPMENLYVNLGFSYEGTTKPNYTYCSDTSYKRIRKEKFRKQILIKKYGFGEDMSETEMTQKLGYGRIWDCGLFKYVWRNPSSQK